MVLWIFSTFTTQINIIFELDKEALNLYIYIYIKEEEAELNGNVGFTLNYGLIKPSTVTKVNNSLVLIDGLVIKINHFL